ncbi:MAG: hypothetical protein CM1200mP20_10850 [Pseudomonadota bacterium]|nr:MAG: hypothetical protein CM1200mP20_10850 [Pseudomonadota bacterium]
MVRQYIVDHGFEVPVFGSFNEEDDNRAARISTEASGLLFWTLAGTMRETPYSCPVPACGWPKSSIRSNSNSENLSLHQTMPFKLAHTFVWQA